MPEEKKELFSDEVKKKYSSEYKEVFLQGRYQTILEIIHFIDVTVSQLDDEMISYECIMHRLHDMILDLEKEKLPSAERKKVIL